MQLVAPGQVVVTQQPDELNELLWNGQRLKAGMSRPEPIGWRLKGSQFRLLQRKKLFLLFHRSDEIHPGRRDRHGRIQGVQQSVQMPGIDVERDSIMKQ